jgi:hypothetical protein
MLRLAAIKGWCGDEAANYLIYYSKPNSDDPYTDVENMIQHLKLIYGWPKRKHSFFQGHK